MDREESHNLGELVARTQAHQQADRRAALVADVAEPSDAVLLALDVLRSGRPADRVDTFTSLQARVDRLINVATDAALRELAAHAVVLDELFAHWTVEALHARSFEARTKYMKLGLQAQSAHARTLALVATLRSQQEARAAVVLHDDED